MSAMASETEFTAISQRGSGIYVPWASVLPSGMKTRHGETKAHMLNPFAIGPKVPKHVSVDRIYHCINLLYLQLKEMRC